MHKRSAFCSDIIILYFPLLLIYLIINKLNILLQDFLKPADAISHKSKSAGFSNISQFYQI